MALLEWTESLAVGEGVIDHTHEEFVSLLNSLADADDASALELLDAFLEHSETHFGQESRWMTELGYSAQQCHEDEHTTVMQIARAVREKLATGQGDASLTRFLAAAVAEWFVNHAQTMDAVLSLYMKEHGYAPTADKA